MDPKWKPSTLKMLPKWNPKPTKMKPPTSPLEWIFGIDFLEGRPIQTSPRTLHPLCVKVFPIPSKPPNDYPSEITATQTNLQRRLRRYWSPTDKCGIGSMPARTGFLDRCAASKLLLNTSTSAPPYKLTVIKSEAIIAIRHSLFTGPAECAKRSAAHLGTAC